jgi:signal transduction histidine kinase
VLEVPRNRVERRTARNRDRGHDHDLWGIRCLRHDVRQPLSAVLLMVASLRADTNLSPKARESLRRIEHEAEWMAELLSAADDDAVRTVDVGAVVEDTVRAARAVSQPDLQFVQQAEAHVVADSVNLRRAVRNLVDNAVRAVGADGTVCVTVGRNITDALVEVADSGPGFGGIPRQQGLGLMSVRRFLDDVGGSLAVGASTFGGALVTLRLPLAAEDPHLDHGASA